MKIVTNTIPLLSPLTGVGNYTHSLVSEFMRLRPDWKYSYYYGYFTGDLHNISRTSLYRFIKILKKYPFISSQARRMKFRMAAMHLRPFDTYFEPNFIPLPIRAKKTVTTVHDFSFHKYPQWLPDDRRQYFSEYFFKRIRKSDMIITVSEYIRSEALDILKIGSDRIVTIPNGFNSSIFNTGDQPSTYAGKKYILFAGSIEPRKNIIRLLMAYSMLPENIQKDFSLVLAGFQGWDNMQAMDLLEKLKGRVSYLGYVSDVELASLYRNASCFVYPSLYEGFGLPPLEAMACGCPVVVSKAASMPEVCGEAAYYVNPDSAESIAEGIFNVIADSKLRISRIDTGLERVKLFSWGNSARDHLRVFDNN